MRMKILKLMQMRETLKKVWVNKKIDAKGEPPEEVFK